MLDDYARAAEETDAVVAAVAGLGQAVPASPWVQPWTAALAG